MQNKVSCLSDVGPTSSITNIVVTTHSYKNDAEQGSGLPFRLYQVD